MYKRQEFRWSATVEASSNRSGFTSTTCSWVVAWMLTTLLRFPSPWEVASSTNGSEDLDLSLIHICVLVDPMDDPRPDHPVDGGEPPLAVVEQRVYQRPILIEMCIRDRGRWGGGADRIRCRSRSRLRLR